MFSYSKKISFKDIDKQFNELSDKVRKISFPKSFSQFILYGISELLTNVKDHSQSTRVLLEVRINSKQALVKIEDNGIGFKKSYQIKKIYPKDDSTAIEWALSGLSTKDLKKRGFGLFSLRKLIEHLKGKIIIESSNASCLIEKNTISFKRLKKEKRGVKIVFSAPIKSFDFYEIIK